MKLLIPHIGCELNSLITDSTTDDDCPRSTRREEEYRIPSPTILWATELLSGTKLVIVDEHPRRMIVVRSFLDRPEVLGNVAIAHQLTQHGILHEEAAEARKLLPLEISEELPPLVPVQLPLAFLTALRAAG